MNTGIHDNNGFTKHCLTHNNFIDTYNIKLFFVHNRQKNNELGNFINKKTIEQNKNIINEQTEYDVSLLLKVII